MARKSKELRFQIDVFTPDTIPLARLAEYMANLASLVGNQERVHFKRIAEGSTVLVNSVEWEAVPKVKERLRAVRRQDGPEDALRAFHAIDRKLREDNATASLDDFEGEVIKFPGRDRVAQPEYGPFNQAGSLDGVLIRIGGQEAMVPVHLEERDGRLHICQANRETARRMAPYLFGAVIRVQGEGRWFRHENGEWEMRRFTISDFLELRDEPFADSLERLRRHVSKSFASKKDPIADLAGLRSGAK